MNGMKIVEYLLDTKAKRSYFIFLLFLLLCLRELFFETVFGFQILNSNNTKDVLNLVQNSFLRGSLVSQVVFNYLQYSQTNGFVKAFIIHTIKIKDLLMLLLMAIYLKGGQDDFGYEKNRITTLVLVISYIVKFSLFMFSTIHAFGSGDTAIGLARLKVGARLLSFGSFVLIIYLVIRLFISFYQCYFDNHFSRD